MTRRRFYATPAAFDFDAGTVTLASDETRHLRNVLRLKTGDEVFAFDGEGAEYKCRIAICKSDTTVLEVGLKVESGGRESPLHLTLALGLLKGEKFDFVVQKATELGVARIVPLITQFGDFRSQRGTDTARRSERWRRIALEAAKQSGRARLPLIELPEDFSSWVARDSKGDGTWKVMFSERGGSRFLSAIQELVNQPISVSALVGPEGGWSDEEIIEAREAGRTVITLGGRTLRAETAAIVVISLLQREFGDLR